jgi:ABC-type multidrug transport system fused ATPase/permease subunit
VVEETLMKSVNFLAPFVLPYWRRLSLAVLAAIGSSFADVLRPWPVKIIVDDVIGNSSRAGTMPMSPLPGLVPRDQTWVLLVAVALILAVAGLRGLLAFGEQLWMVQAGQRVVFALRVALYGHIQRLSLGFHDAHRTGDLLARVTNDIEAMQDMVTIGLPSLVSNALTLAAMVLIMAMIDWQFAVLALSVTPLLFAVVYRYTRRIRQASRVARRKEGEVNAVAQETFAAVRLVRAFGRETHEDQRFRDQNEQSLSASVEANSLQAQFAPLVELVVALGTCLVAFVGAEQVLQGRMSVGGLLVFLSYLAQMYSPLRQLSKLGTVFGRATASAERVAEIMDTSLDLQDRPDAIAAVSVKGHVTFEGVSFAYGYGSSVLHDIDLCIEPGHTVALVGATGAGKSTLVSLLQRFYDPTEGRILLDGTDLRQLTIATLRGCMSVVPQESVLFRTTIAENIAYGRPSASTDEIIVAARAANAHEFILELADGYDTIVSERGQTLSGGQRQRIAIARAIVRNAPILILDEPTASLDAEAEASTLEAIHRLCQGRTTFIIAHRLSTVRSADTIVVLDHGSIIERGTHAELLARGGYYRRLLSLQFGSLEQDAELIRLEPDWRRNRDGLQAVAS